MVTLTYPLENENKYLTLDGVGIGPLGPSATFTGDTVSYVSESDSMVEWKGPYHENGVRHWKHSAEITYLPEVHNIESVPTTANPDRVRIPIGSGAWSYLSYGTSSTGLSGRNIGSTRVRHYGCVQESEKTWTIYCIEGGVTNKKVYNAEKSVYEVTAINGMTCTLRKVRTYLNVYVLGVNTSYLWKDRQSVTTLASIYQTLKAFSTEQGGTPTTTMASMWNAVFVSHSPSTLRGMVYTFCEGMSLKQTLPEEMSYGDLAMKASENVNATNINVIAFIRDIKNPKSLIPKLRNLRKLKGIADNYLTVNYGILPTISDIQNLVGAFERIKPYLDRNGFEVFTAGDTTTSQSETTQIDVVRRIKLAVDNEDNGFDALAEGFERFGVLPSFKNIWDLIPYSFAIDWLIDVGLFLERVDTHLRVLRLNIRYATMSRKETVQTTVVANRDFPMSGSMSRVQYHRWVSDQCPLPALSLQPAQTGFDHWVEAGALLVQRAK